VTVVAWLTRFRCTTRMSSAEAAFLKRRLAAKGATESPPPKKARGSTIVFDEKFLRSAEFVALAERAREDKVSGSLQRVFLNKITSHDYGQRYVVKAEIERIEMDPLKVTLWYTNGKERDAEFAKFQQGDHVISSEKVLVKNSVQYGVELNVTGTTLTWMLASVLVAELESAAGQEEEARLTAQMGA
jgi:hypothetical protein